LCIVNVAAKQKITLLCVFLHPLKAAEAFCGADIALQTYGANLAVTAFTTKALVW
jgi:hypothetical protein